MESNTLLATVVFLVASIGVGGFTVPVLNKMYGIDYFKTWTDGNKRAFAIAVACLIVTVLWGFGLYMRYFDLPAPSLRAWVEAWFAVIFPASSVQQLIQGYTKPDQGNVT